MEVRFTCGLFALVLLSGCGRLSAFNLDTDNVLEKSGDQGSLFGFSLALHHQLQPEEKRMVLVGAPRANALGKQKAKVTGGLYSCDMSSAKICKRVAFDQEEDTNKESKENQWMGVAVSSQGPGGKVVTCAHRYQRRSNVLSALESRDIIGRCYVFSQNLEFVSPYEDGGDWHFCDNRPRGHEMFGSCQQGVSATFDKDYHYVIFGAPGAYDWKGIVRLEQKNESYFELDIFDDGPFETGDEREKDPTLVPAVPNSYLGFSLDSGSRLTHQNQLTVVAGAPRANHSGAVVLLKKDPNNNRLLEEYTLEGEGLASSFGYDVTVLDLNRDGWQDIVVGAPQYFEKDGEIGGAVYVYINKAGKWDKIKPTRIDGEKDSMFGIAVANLGDINMDGYDDFAVGAPYEKGSQGKVYIYSGSAADIFPTEAVQVLSGQSGVKQFGYSLVGNMDLDGNSYPDLVIGSLSDSVFIYKTRPVINIKKKIEFSPKDIDLEKPNCDGNFCVTLKVCLSYTANPASYTPKLVVEYTLAVDADNKEKNLAPRATFKNPTDKSTGVISLNSKGQEMCDTRQLVIQDNIRDKLRAIPVDVSVEIKDSKRKRRQSSDAPAPVLDPKLTKTRKELPFVKLGCGKDNVCRSNLQVTYRYGQGDSPKKFVPLQKDQNGVPVISLTDQKDITLEVTVMNKNGDGAHEAYLDATFPPSVTYSAFRSEPNKQPVNCMANNNGSKVECELGNPFPKDAETTFYVNVSTAGITLTTADLEIDLQLRTTSKQDKLALVKAKLKVAIGLQLSLSGRAQPSQVYFTGKAKGNSNPETENHIGSAVAHHFTILNRGKSLSQVGTATLNIKWPKITKDGLGLLYLMNISATGVDKIQCTPKEENLFNVKPSNTRSRRAVSNTEGIGHGTFSYFKDKKSASLSCDSDLQCASIKCPLRGLDSNAVITLHFRLWNSTFVKHYSDMHHVEVVVMASLHVDSTRHTKLEKAETQVKLTVFPDRREAQYGGVPWWIIVLSILFLLLLLGLLAFLLWKCGVFGKRTNKENAPEKETLTSDA